MEFKVRLVKLENGLYQVQRGQVEYEDSTCGGSYVESWDVLYENLILVAAKKVYEEAKRERLTDVVEVIDEFSFKVG